MTEWWFHPTPDIKSQCFERNKKFWLGNAPSSPAATECGLPECLDCESGAYRMEAVNKDTYGDFVPSGYQMLSGGAKKGL